jgi:hypothetical protein
MNREYGELMSFLLERRAMFDAEEEFRGFVIESIRAFARDLRDLNVEISIKQDAFGAPRPSRDWNSLKIGCE